MLGPAAKDGSNWHPGRLEQSSLAYITYIPSTTQYTVVFFKESFTLGLVRLRP